MKRIFLLFVVLLLQFSVSAQNCSVNAGIQQDICAGGAVVLGGNSAGLIDVPAEWSQIAGPGVIIDDPADEGSGITGTVPGNSYTFRIQAQCQDGATVFDDVVINALALTVPDAGADISECPGAYNLSGNAFTGDETGVWAIPGGNPAGVVINDINDPNSGITLPNGVSGTTTLTWTITNNVSACVGVDFVTVTNNGGKLVVDAGPDVTLSNCYTATQSTTLDASFAGTGLNGQTGTWNLVSGPNYPTFGDANDENSSLSGLIEGTYVIEWTVTGPCAQGSDQVTITVPAATQDVTEANGANVLFCSPTTNALLVGNPASFSGENVSWVQTAGPAAVITDDAASTTSVTGLDGASNYNFTYTVTNPTTGCVSTDVVTIRYRTILPTISFGNDTLMSCGDSLVAIPFTATGNGTTQYSIIDGPFTQGFQTDNSSPINLNLNQEGTYTIRIRKRETGLECDEAFDDIIVVVGFPPTLSNGGTDQTLACGVTTANLAANAPTDGTGNWYQVSGPNNATIVDPTLTTSAVNGLIGGSYVFKWLIASQAPSCDSEESEVTVTVSEPIGVISAGPDQNACENSPVTLNASALNHPETGQWTAVPAGPVFQDDTSPTTLVTGLTNAVGTYTFTWTVSNGCPPVQDDVVITVSGTQGASAANAGADLCIGTGIGSTPLSGNTPTVGDGEWFLVSGPGGSSFTSSTNPTTDFNMAADGTYELVWTVSEPGCQSNSDTLVITQGTPAVADAGADQEICYNGAFNLNASSPVPGIGTWTITGGPNSAVFADVNDPTSGVTFTEPGVYTFNWSIDAGACAAGANEDEVKISVSLQPTTANAGPDQIICGDTEATLAGNLPIVGEGSWSIVGTVTNTPSIDDIANAGTDVENMATGVFTYEWSIYSGPFCPASTDQVAISVSAPANAGPDQNLCDATEALVTGTDGTTGTWVETSAHGAAIATNTGYTSITGLMPGNVYSFEFTAPALFGCPATTDEVVINTSQYATTPDAGIDQNLCLSGGNSLTMAANVIAVGTGAWNLISGPNAPVFTANDPTTTVNNLVQGLYIFEWTASNGNCANYSDPIRLNVYEPPTVANAGADQPLACPTGLTLEGNTPVNGIGTWTQSSGPASTIDFPIQPETSISDILTAPGTYIYDWTISVTGGVCPASTDQVTITIPTLAPTTPMAGTDFTVCNDGTTTMAANQITDGIGTWINVSGPNVPVIDAPNSETSDLNGLIDGDYVMVWQAVNGGCIVNDTIEFGHFPLPSASNAGTDANFCPFATVELSGNTPVSGIGTWNMVSGPSAVIFGDANNPNTAVAGTLPGTYVFEWSISTGAACTPETDQVTIIVESNCAPTTENENETTPEDTPLVVPAGIGILANDSDGEADNLSVNTTPVSGPSNGGIVLAADGSYTYTPSQDFNGTDTVVVSVCDDGVPPLCANDTIFITVTPVNDPPLIIGENSETNQDTPINNILVTNNDSDVDGNLDTTAVTVPTGMSTNGGTVTVNPDGTINFAPTIGYVGNDTIIYQVCDSLALCDTAMLIINVIGDSDGDGIVDSEDLDDDNDGIPDVAEEPGDSDGDGIPDSLDLDSDNDGIPDIIEAGGTDTDGDGEIDYPTPGDPTSMTDADGDGLADEVDDQDSGSGAGEVTGGTPLTNSDSDGDGIADAVDLDADNDGIPDVVEAGGTDADGDGQIDGYTDADNDGFADAVDSNNNINPGTGDGGTPLPTDDTDGDGVLNHLDLDADNDGIPDVIEAGGTDTDGDGVLDGFTDADNDGFADAVDTDDNTTPGAGDGGTSLPNEDADMDGIPNNLDKDSDNDGITDIIEAGGVDTNGDGEIDYPTEGDPTSMDDVDGDGLADVVDTDDNTTPGTDDGGTALDVPNTDGTGGPNYLDIDSDSDGVVDNVEGQTSVDYTAPSGTDTDGDGIDDAYDPDNGGDNMEPNNHDGDGAPDYTDLDSDNDGESDLIEAHDLDGDGVADTTPDNADTDGDGLDDAFDVNPLDGTNGPGGTNASNGTTDPLTDGTFADADNPGVNDLDFRENDTDGDGIEDSVDLDDDNDGIPDTEEICGPGATNFDCIGGDPTADADGDGVPNFNDPDFCTLNAQGVCEDLDTDGDGIMDHLDLDSDNDGIPDVVEAGGTDNDGDGIVDNFTDADNDGQDDTVVLPNLDSDGDGIPNSQDLDSDNDGTPDVTENGGTDTDGDGVLDGYVDTDGDGFSDVVDSDDNSTPGTGDGGTPLDIANSDSDGLPDFLDLDSDNDGIPDVVENGGTDADGDGEIDGFTDVDGDGFADSVDTDDNTNPGTGDGGTPLPNSDTDMDGIPNAQDLDSDNDGIVDAIEAGGADTNGDGELDDFADADGNGLSDVVDTDEGGTPLLIPDTDGTGGPNYLDIDSDGDGIVDNVEGQSSAGYIAPLGIDTDGDGLDDAYDTDNGGTAVDPYDHDGDTNPDYTDLDSDNDGESDLLEGHDTDGDGVADTTPLGTDADGDGLDDAFDTNVLDGTNGPDGTNASNGTTDPLTDGTFADADAPGIGDLDFRENDNDGDGIPDIVDLDDDNDGIPDLVEDPNSNDPTIPLLDTDNDGIPDIFDLDADNDGIPDIVEAGGTDANNDGRVDDLNPDGTLVNDTDGDGLDDFYDADNGGTAIPNEDTDGDGQADFQDVDSDNDGIYDIVETGGTDADNDGKVDDWADADGDQIPDYADVDQTGGADLDGDGIDDAFQGGLDSDMDGIQDSSDEDPNGTGWDVNDALTGTEDTDGDNIPDHLDLDTDNDGIPDIVEDGGDDTDGDGMIDDFVDADGDGADDDDMTDGLFDFDEDGVPDHEDLDSDNDGISDVVEAGNTDNDGDGMIDNIKDDNGDGMDDNNAVSDPIDSDNDGNPDYNDLDSDNDGIEDITEAGGTDVDGDGTIDDFIDANGDGMDDEDMINDPVDSDGDGTDDYLDLDSDDDGISDEIENDSNNDGAELDDSDGDGIPDYLDVDSDNDGKPDSEEGAEEDCDDDGILNFIDEDPCDIIVPEAFSPNNDGLNDFFVIDGLQSFPDNNIIIFNRWGNKVYEQDGYANDWDGLARDAVMNINNNELPTGTYYYLLTYKDDEGAEHLVKGYIYLER